MLHKSNPCIIHSNSKPTIKVETCNLHFKTAVHVLRGIVYMNSIHHVQMGPKFILHITFVIPANNQLNPVLFTSTKVSVFIYFTFKEVRSCKLTASIPPWPAGMQTLPEVYPENETRVTGNKDTVKHILLRINYVNTKVIRILYSQCRFNDWPILPLSLVTQ